MNMKTLRRVLLVAAQILIGVCVILYGGARYLTSMPEMSYEGMLPPITEGEKELADRLRRHVEAIARTERNLAHPDELEKAARYIETTLEKAGLAPKQQVFTVDGKTVRNIEVTIDGRGGGASPEVLVIGAHYDSDPDSPGANDNASGTAALLELAPRLLATQGQASRQIRLVFFPNGERPHFQTDAMGSRRYVQALAERKERVAAMLALDSIGYYSNAAHSQSHALVMNLVLPSRGDFIAFLARHSSYALLREAVGSFRRSTQFPSIGAAGPGFHPAVNDSDHWAFAEHGVPALVVTDTGPYRNPHDRKPTDTPDTIDYERMARVVKGLEPVIRAVAR
jgi:Zn-dependent M28 family amino/carboxypeptidase